MPQPSLLPSEDAAPAEESAVPDEAPKPDEPLRFTVRNEILHGPVLGLSGFGIARVDSHFVLSDKIRKEIEEIFGPKDPLEDQHARRIPRRWHHHVQVRRPHDQAEGFQGRDHLGDLQARRRLLEERRQVRHRRQVAEVRGQRPRENTKFVMTDMTMDGDGKRVRGDLYDGDFNFAIEQFTFVGKGGENVEVNDLHYIVNSETKGDFTGVSAKMGSAR